MTPWQVLVSEFFLRKTGAAKVDPVVRELLRRAPTPRAMASMRHASLVKLITPLGLQNVRAKALREIARTLVREHGGRVPRDADVLRALPHVGRYMANSVLTVGFGEPRPVVDANIMRIMNRVFGVPTAIEIHKADSLWEFAQRFLPRGDVEKSKEVNWALVDFGALVCRAREPLCPECPMRRTCLFAQRRK